MIHSHMSKLSGLRKLFDTIDIQVGSLKNLSYEPCRYGPLLILIIASKIPNNLNLIISRKFDSADDWDIEIVLNTLKTEIITREKTVLLKTEIITREKTVLVSRGSHLARDCSLKIKYFKSSERHHVAF